jgi:hypothetical protein
MALVYWDPPPTPWFLLRASNLASGLPWFLGCGMQWSGSASLFKHSADYRLILSISYFAYITTLKGIQEHINFPIYRWESNVFIN